MTVSDNHALTCGNADLSDERRWLFMDILRTACGLRTSLSSAVANADHAAVAHLKTLLAEWAQEFAHRRADVESATIVWPRRGLMSDEAASFLRAMAEGFALVDEAGYVSLPSVRTKAPAGRYALLSKRGTGVSINLEYLIQIGATAELVLDHGWPPESIDFERGEFDALASVGDRVVLAMEAKARTTGPDSLEKLVTFWLQALSDPTTDLNNNAGRKLRELHALCAAGPISVWLVAEGARWCLRAQQGEAGLELTPGTEPDWSTISGLSTQGLNVTEPRAFDPAFHRPGSVAAAGHCSQHGLDSCPNPPVISFVDRNGRRQSGCRRAAEELSARGEIALPPDLGDGRPR